MDLSSFMVLILVLTDIDESHPFSSLTHARSRRQQYAAAQTLLSMAGVKVRQHCFRRQVLLELGPD